MTRDTQVDIIETRTNKEPTPIGFISSYLPSSSKEISMDEKISPPYPVDASSSGTFPIPCPMAMQINNQNTNFSNIKLNELSTLPSAPTVIDLDDQKTLTNFEKQEIEKELSNLKCRVLGTSDDEKREFLNEQHKVLTKIDNIKFRLSAEERNDFDKRLREIDEIRMLNINGKDAKENDEEIYGKESSEEVNETSTKCAFDISSLLPKFPQLVIIILII